MADIRISQLPTGTPTQTKLLAMDLGTTEKATIKEIVYAGRPAATQAQAEAGTDSDAVMTPLTSAQQLAALGPTALGLGSAAFLNVGTTINTVAAGDDSRIVGAAQKSANLSDLTNVATARNNLELGGAALLAVGIIAGTVAAGDDSRIVGAAQKSANLSDLASVSTARTNLGLGGAAILNVGTTAGTVAAGNDSRIVNAIQPNTTPTLSGLTVSTAGATASISINGDAGQERRLYLKTAGVDRWFMRANATAESGSNAGSNWELVRSADNGVVLGTAISVTRSNGKVSFEVIPSAAGNDVVVNTGSAILSTVTLRQAAGNNRYVQYQTSTSNRWTVGANNVAESGSNAGSNYVINRHSDAGAEIGTAVSIDRATGVMTLAATPVIPGLPNLSSDVQGTGVAGLNDAEWFLWSNPSTWEDSPTLRIDRHVNDASGGVAANTYSALWVLGSSATSGEGYEWTAKVEFTNKTAKTSGAENLAFNCTAFISNEAVEVGKTWGANLNLTDQQGTPNPERGRVAVEVNNYSLPTGGADGNRARVGIQLAVGSSTGVAPDPGTPLHIGRGFLVGAAQANVIIDRLMEVSGVGSYGIGIDTTGATFTSPVYLMAEAQRIAFDGATTGSYTRSLRYQTGALIYETLSGLAVSVSDVGNMTLLGNLSLATGKVVQVAGLTVLTNRKTGYTNAMTGTANRATSYATSTITLVQLAERVKALQDDLTTHGLIGV